MSADPQRSVLIFKSHLLPYSETFVVDQSRPLTRYRPIYVGLRRVRGLELPADSTEVLNFGGLFGRLFEYGYAVSGWSPGFMRRLRGRRPALIHAHFGPSGVLALPMCRALRVPMVVTYHGYDATVIDRDLRKTGYAGLMYVRRREQLKHSGAQFIAVSRFIADRLVAQGFPPERIRVHYTGIDVDRFRPDAGVTREKVVLFVGRFVSKKGCEYLVRAMAHVQAKHPDVRVVLIGDGPLRASLQELAGSLQLQATFTGPQPIEFVQQWMKQASVLCLPSVTAPNGDSEGLGMVLLEAQASGLPVVASRHGPIPEAVLHGETGFLVEEADVAGLAEALTRVLSDREWHAAASQRARNYAGEHFNMRTQTEKLQAIYDQCVDLAAGGATVR